MPYGVPDVVEVCPKTIYYSTIRYLNHLAPYIPIRVLWQFGDIQIILSEPIHALIHFVKPANIKKYSIEHPDHDDCWRSPKIHVLGEHYTTYRALPSYLALPIYMAWYIPWTHPQIHPEAKSEEHRQMREPPAYPHVYEFGRLTEECVPNEVEYVEGHPYMMMVHKDKYQDVYDHCTPFNEYMLF